MRTPPTPRPHRPARADPDRARAAALGLGAEHGLPDRPGYAGLLAVAKAAGVHVRSVPFSGALLGVYVAIGPGLIILGRNQSRAQRRWTLAHELGHHLLHRGLSGVRGLNRLAPLETQDADVTAAVEAEAEAFAAALTGGHPPRYRGGRPPAAAGRTGLAATRPEPQPPAD
jgi:hypothetical protein